MSPAAKTKARIALGPYAKAVGQLEVAEALRDFDETYAVYVDLERQHAAAVKQFDRSGTDLPERAQVRRDLVAKIDRLGERYDEALAAWGVATEALGRVLRGALSGHGPIGGAA